MRWSQVSLKVTSVASGLTSPKTGSLLLSYDLLVVSGELSIAIASGDAGYFRDVFPTHA
jgi:hypothetical protein